MSILKEIIKGQGILRTITEGILSILAITAIVMFIILTSSCVTSEIMKVGESGADIYSTVKTANTLGVVADSAKVLSNVRKIKAETTQAFQEGISIAIARQPLTEQAKLLKQGIEAKVTIAKNNTLKGLLIATVVWAVFLLIMRIAVFLFNRYKPLAKEVTKSF